MWTMWSRKMGTQVRQALKTPLRTIMGRLDGTNVRLAMKTHLRTIIGGLCVSPANNTRFEETLTRIRGPERWARVYDLLIRPIGPVDFVFEKRSARK